MAKRASTSNVGNDIFASAPVIVKGNSTVRQRVIPMLGNLKACLRTEGVIQMIAETLDEQAKAIMVDIFLTEGKNMVKPDNFTGVDGNQTGSCQLKVRNFGPNGMNEEVANELRAMKLGDLVEEKETFQFNQELLTPEVMATITKALSTVALPVGILTKQVRRGLKPKAVDSLFAKHGDSLEIMTAALPLVTSLAIRCDYDKTDENFQGDFATVIGLLGMPAFAEVAASAARDPDQALKSPSEKRDAAKKAAAKTAKKAA